MNLKRILVYTPLLLLASLATAQVPVTVSPIPQFQAFDQSGRPLAFGCVFTYQSGTTTPLATYSDYTGLIANANPVALSASGSANIWIQSGQIYTFVVESAGGTDCSTGTVMYSVDGIGSGAPQTVTTVASSTTPSFAVIAQIQLFKLTLTANAVALPVSFVNVQAPAIITFQITQDATGSRTFTWPTNVTGGGTIDPTANHTTTQSFVWNGSTILPIGNAFTSVGNSALIGTIYSTNTFTGPQTFTGGITVTGGAVIDSVTTPTIQAAGNGTSLSLSAAAGTSGNTAGGNYSVSAGAGIGSGAGGNVSITAGAAPGAGAGGNLTLTAGNSVGGVGGTIALNNTAGNLIQLNARRTSHNRLFASFGTAQSAGNVGLSGWGTGATFTITGTDTLMRISVTAGTGPSANPSVSVTFADGSFGSLPGAYCFATRPEGTPAAPTTAYWTAGTSGVTATSVGLTFIGTPVAASSYVANVLCLGTVGTF